MYAVRQIMGGRRQYLTRQAIADTAQNRAKQQQQGQKNGRNVDLQGKTTCHGVGRDKKQGSSYAIASPDIGASGPIRGFPPF